MVKIKKRLYKFKSSKNNYTYYTIRFKDIIVANRSDYNEIIEIYNECVKCNWDLETIHEIRKKYRIYRADEKMKYIYQNQKGIYYIHRFDEYWCCSKDLDKILEYRDELDNIGWNMEAFKHRKRKRDIPKHIYKSGDKYKVYYQSQHYGTYNTLEDAITDRDLLIEFDWDYNFVDLY